MYLPTTNPPDERYSTFVPYVERINEETGEKQGESCKEYSRKVPSLSNCIATNDIANGGKAALT